MEKVAKFQQLIQQLLMHYAEGDVAEGRCGNSVGV